MKPHLLTPFVANDEAIPNPSPVTSYTLKYL